MRNDLNFFSPYQGRKRERNDNRKYIYSIGATLILVIAGTLIWNIYSLYTVQSDIDDYKAKLSDKSFQTKLAETEKAEKKAALLKGYNTGFTSLTSAIESRTSVTTNRLNALSSTLPSEVSFDEIQVDKKEITIKAVSKRRSAIGELQHNLATLEIIQEVHIGNITDNETGFTCDIKCALKDDDDENK